MMVARWSKLIVRLGKGRVGAGWKFSRFLADGLLGSPFLSFAVAPHRNDGRAIAQTHSQVGGMADGDGLEVW